MLPGPITAVVVKTIIENATPVVVVVAVAVRKSSIIENATPVVAGVLVRKSSIIENVAFVVAAVHHGRGGSFDTAIATLYLVVVILIHGLIGGSGLPVPYVSTTASTVRIVLPRPNKTSIGGRCLVLLVQFFLLTDHDVVRQTTKYNKENRQRVQSRLSSHVASLCGLLVLYQSAEYDEGEEEDGSIY